MDNGAADGQELDRKETADGAPFVDRIKQWPFPSDEVRAERTLIELREQATADPALAPLAELLARDSVTKLLSGTTGCSPYLMQLCNSDLPRLMRILTDAPEQRMTEMRRVLAANIDAAGKIDDAMEALRNFKNEAALLIALCDLGGVWPVMTVTRNLSDVADAAVQSSLRFLFAQAVQKGDWLATDGDPAPEASSGYFVLAMGKHGAFELNYSSDIDLIVFYDPAKARLREGLEIKTFFVRLTRDLVKLMQERTKDGYVFRTDLRLRPDPGATQVAISTDAALSYYESFGQNWERAALIKARVIAGDLEAGNAFYKELTPYIWRKYLDFAAISDIHAMKRQIHAFKGFGSIGVAGHNIKLGRGGIREIEFFAQTQQLIAGGRQEDLRAPATLDALKVLTKRGWIEEPVRADLEASYLYLRAIEHRLQMLNDEQTQTLPADDEGLLQVARFSGYESLAGFDKDLREALVKVQTHYAGLFEDQEEAQAAGENLVFAGEDDDPATIEHLKTLGYRNPQQVIAFVRGWHRGRYAAMRSAMARERLTEIQPLLIEALAKTAEPDKAILAFDGFLAHLPTGVQLFALLKANPSLMRLVADIMGSAPRLARILSRRRRVLDAVLDPGFFGTTPTDKDLAHIVDDELRPLDDYQEVLDRARIIGNEQMFLIGVRVLSRTIGAGRAGGVYAALAARIISVMQDKVTAELIANHGSVAGGAASVIAMGKLGGNEMTAASDLDLILVYDFDKSQQQSLTTSESQRALSPGQFYARLTQRMISALAAPTAEGTIYEVDLRLRPSGQKGPVATQLSSFISYQAEEAWTWEHMALTRARVLTGPPDLRARIETAIHDCLTMRRDRAKVVRDVRDMRERIAAEKGTDDSWDLKQVRGGILDLEFIAQFLQLVHAADHPGILEQNTYTAFGKLKKAGLIEPDKADILIDAANFMNNLTQVLRLCLDSSFDSATALHGLKDLLCRAAELPDFQRVEAELRRTLDDVKRLFDELIA